ncbi:MAG: PD-(D/E)XK nuclease family protein [Armatimonadetes bacterium]|nr:PD-(D/E)XK nuclease family protein [Armatimonadota bacterium]
MLHAAADILQERYARGNQWDLGGVLIALPGRQAGRRLRQLLDERAAGDGLRLVPPETVTPADLPERLYAPPPRVATPAEAFFAWVQAVRRLAEDDRRTLAPRMAESGGPLAGAGLAEHVLSVRADLMAEGLTLGDAARRCAALPGFCEDRRWGALARLEELYVGTLSQAGLTDRDDSRWAALDAGTLSCEQDIVLVGTVDLNAQERAMLRRLPSPVLAVLAVLPAPPEVRDGFDDVGGLIADFWHDRPLPLPDERLCFVEDPAAEAHALADRLAALDGRYAPDEITLGVGDERTAEGLARRLALLGLPTVSPYGLPLARVRPAALLSALRDYLHDPSARRFATLVRHADLETWLESRPGLPSAGDAPLPASPSQEEGFGGAGESPCPLLPPLIAKEGPGEVFLDALDTYLAEHLPERLPEEGLPPVLEDARNALETLLSPLRTSRALPDWAEPVADILRAVYGNRELDDACAEDRQLRRGLAGIAAALRDIKRLNPALAPRLSGRDALAFALGRLDGLRLPADGAETGMAMMGWLELALDDAPVLLLTGLHEGGVPAGTPADPLLPDALRRRLGLPDSRRRQARDAFLLCVLMESRPHLHLVVARRGADGEPQRPSRLLFLGDGGTVARRARRFAEGADAPPIPLLTSGSARRLPPPRPEPLATPLTRLRVTAFRDYLACPYRFYLRHVLGLDERDDAADEMDARRFGILLHESLAAFARAPIAESPDPAAVQRFLRAELRRQARAQFGGDPSPPVRLQVRQAGRRLDAFARWQARQTAEGWLIQYDLSERDLEAEIWVDNAPFTLTGRLDRVDYHPGEDKYRIIDYKTGDAGQSPDEKHRGAADGDGTRPWTDLQLPLYRTLAGANGVAEDRLEVGYVLLSADLSPVSFTDKGRRDGGLGYVPVPWKEPEFGSARACAESVIRALRAEAFWPPAAPPRFPDAYSPLCLDSCRDRAEWLAQDWEAEREIGRESANEFAAP